MDSYYKKLTLTTIASKMGYSEAFVKVKKYRCILCDYIYDPALGDPDNGINPGTAFEDLPDNWQCPVCFVGKEEFEPIEE